MTKINVTTIKSIAVSVLLCGCRNNSSSARNELLLLHVGVVIIKSTSVTTLSRVCRNSSSRSARNMLLLLHVGSQIIITMLQF